MGTSLSVFIGQWCWPLLEFGQRVISLSDCYLPFLFLSPVTLHLWTLFFKIVSLEFLFSCFEKNKKQSASTYQSTSNFTSDPSGVKPTVHCWWSGKFAPVRAHRPTVTNMLWPLTEFRSVGCCRLKPVTLSVTMITMICCGLPFAWHWRKSGRWWRRRWKHGHVVCT